MFRVLLIILAIILLFPVLATLASLVLFGALLWPINEFLWTSAWQANFALGTFVFLLAIPFVALFVWIVRRISGAKRASGILAAIFGFLWLIGVASLILLIVSVSRDILYYEHSNPENITMTIQPQSDRLSVLVSDPALYFSHRYWWLDDEPFHVSLSEDSLKLATIGIKVLPSSDDRFRATVKKYSAGNSYEDAVERAEDVEYKIDYKNGVLDLGNSFTIHKENKYRGQLVEVEIRVPEGKRIRFEESVRQKLDPVSVELRRKKRRWGRGIRISFDDRKAFPYRTDTDYEMRANGKLRRVR